MKKIMFLMMIVVLLAVPMTSFADNKKEKCESRCLDFCSNQGDDTHKDCMKVCMDECLRKSSKSEINTPKRYAKDNEAAVLCAL